MATLKDIALEAGVTVSVVSRALSRNPDKHAVVAAETKERIRAIADKRGYRRNLQAEFLRRGQSASIGAFIPEIPDRLVADLMLGICRKASQEGFPVNFFFGDALDAYRRFIVEAESRANSGVITYPFNAEMEKRLGRDFARYRDHGGNIVILCSENDYGEIPVVRVDNYLGGRLAGEYLAKRCDVFLIERDAFPSRTRGCRDVLRERGEKAIVEYVLETFPEKIRAVRAEYPDAVIGVSVNADRKALRLVPDILAVGGRLNENVFLVGYDDQYLTDVLTPPLTTVHQPFRELGELAVSKLINIIYKKKETGAVIAPWLIERARANKRRR